MEDPWKKLISAAKPTAAPQALVGLIMARLADEKNVRLARRKFFVYAGLSLVSAAFLIFSLIVAKGEFAKSDFPTFLSLLWTDFASVVVVWRSYLATLVQSLPLGLVFVLLSVFALINFLRMAIRSIVTAHSPIRHRLI